MESSSLEHTIRVHWKSSVSCDSCETVVKSKSNLRIRGRKAHRIQNVGCRLCVTFGAMEVWSKSEFSEEIKEFQAKHIMPEVKLQTVTKSEVGKEI